MHHRMIRLLSGLAALIGLLVFAPAQSGATLPVVESADWQTSATSGMVHFRLRFHNPSMDMPSEASMGQVHAQMFGAFVPNMMLLHSFDIPELPVDSFFDVFYDISLCDLPGAVCAGQRPSGRTGPEARVPCPPDDHWDGNIDVFWVGGASGSSANVNFHIGTIQACPGGGNSYVHLITGCSSPISWSVSGLCPGWSATLVNEDFTPAPALLPPGWTGYICTRADAGVPVNSTCCYAINMLCAGTPARIDMCATACECPIPVEPTTWGRIKALYR